MNRFISVIKKQTPMYLVLGGLLYLFIGKYAIACMLGWFAHDMIEYKE